MLLGTVDPARRRRGRATWHGNVRRRLRRRVAAGAALMALSPTARRDRHVSRAADRSRTAPRRTCRDAVEIVFRPDPTIWDGRFANVAWLQELPKPLTKITWDNVDSRSARRSPRRHGIAERRPRRSRDRRAARVSGPGLDHAGPGGEHRHAVSRLRPPAGRPCRQRHRLRRLSRLPAQTPRRWRIEAASLAAAGAHRRSPTTQSHHRMDGLRFRARGRSSSRSRAEARNAADLYPDWHARPSLTTGPRLGHGDRSRSAASAATPASPPARPRTTCRWSARIRCASAARCCGCGSTATTPATSTIPRSFFQPVPCMHCEKAPCEMGCPVHATVHSPDGLNQMVYNRCIGTRTCSSYCPYKVRRFNWFDYRSRRRRAGPRKNPDVTVRSRGVMEKCTYCMQRIEAARVAADKENRAHPRRRGRHRLPAGLPDHRRSCSATSTTRNRAVAQAPRRAAAHYALLEELGTRPRTTYLARWNDERAEGGGA